MTRAPTPLPAAMLLATLLLLSACQKPASPVALPSGGIGGLEPARGQSGGIVSSFVLTNAGEERKPAVRQFLDAFQVM